MASPFELPPFVMEAVPEDGIFSETWQLTRDPQVVPMKLILVSNLKYQLMYLLIT